MTFQVLGFFIYKIENKHQKRKKEKRERKNRKKITVILR